MSELIDIFRGPPPDGPGCADVLFGQGGDTAPMGLYARIEFGASKPGKAARVARGAIKVEVPHYRQQRNWTCGDASLLMVGRYFGVGPPDEDGYVKLLHSTPEHGTSPEWIVRGAEKIGLKVVWSGEGMTTAGLKSYLDQEFPVIVDLQAWARHPENFGTDEDDGHYIVACGYGDGLIYFADPSLDKDRGFISEDELDLRWHDKEDGGKTYDHWGLVLSRTDETAGEID
jgi:predicted double-glycine peptidase